MKRTLFLSLLVAAVVSVSCSEVPQQASEKESLRPSPSPSPSPVVQMVAVPQVIGEPLENARELLEENGFEVEVTKRLTKDPRGTVLQQSPTLDELEEGAVLTLTVSKPYPRVPDVAGKKLRAAKRALRNSGFDVRVRRKVSDSPAGTVISQSPAGSRQVRPGRTIKLIVAKAAPPPPPAQNCTPGYSPCLPPASDYDCAGGSGDGPKYTGYVTVTGADPYGLDADGDGVGCE